MSDIEELAKTQVKHTVHSSARLISPKGALRWWRRTLLGRNSWLLKGMLRRLLILGRGRGKTGTTTSLVGHYSTEQIARAVAESRRGRLGRASMLGGRTNMGWNSLNTPRLQFEA